MEYLARVSSVDWSASVGFSPCEKIGNCGVISSYVKGDIEEYIDGIDTAHKVRGTVTDKQGSRSEHYFVCIPPEEYNGTDYIVVDATIDQFTNINKQNNDFIKSSFGSKEEFENKGHSSVLVCKLSDSPYEHSYSTIMNH